MAIIQGLFRTSSIHSVGGGEGRGGDGGLFLFMKLRCKKV